MPFIDNNIALGLSKNADFQVGKSDLDNGSAIEKGITIPYVTDPTGSYLYYDCTVESTLDSGIVVHNRLPQVNNDFDTLSVVTLDDPKMAEYTKLGVNLKCQDQYHDIVQRMGHARYWFNLRGQALRIGYQVPIPSIKTIGGIAVIPYDKNPQRAYNRIFPGGNYSGVILWHAEWSLWYTIVSPPVNNYVPASDPSARISGSEIPPKSIQSPWSLPDDNAMKSGGPKG